MENVERNPAETEHCARALVGSSERIDGGPRAVTRSRKDIARSLLRRHGRTYCAELGIDIAGNKPAPLFRWLVASLLFSARIGAAQAVEAAAALSRAGWRTPKKMAAASWKQRVDVLNTNGYARYDESTSRMLADTSELLLDRYGGDLRRLRDAAGGDASKAEKLLTAFKGIGPTGAAIFLREVQAAWPEFYPYADDRALKAARRLDLGDDAEALARLVAKSELPALLTALVRADLANELDDFGNAA